MASFFISTKVSNTLIQIDFILDNIYKNNIIEINENNEKLKMKDMILKYESDILFSIIIFLWRENAKKGQILIFLKIKYHYIEK